MTSNKLKLPLTLQARRKSECFEANGIIKVKETTVIHDIRL